MISGRFMEQLQYGNPIRVACLLAKIWMGTRKTCNAYLYLLTSDIKIDSKVCGVVIMLASDGPHFFLRLTTPRASDMY